MKSFFLIPFLALSLFVSAQTPSPLEIDLSLFANGFSSPVGLYHAGDERLFVIEQASGRIKVIDANGNALGDFLNINSLISTGGERGLLGLAFHPNYASNGRFFVNYTNNQGNTVVAEYSVSANPNVANPTATQNIITINQDFGNHNGGHIAFGPDGYLYIGMGDGGSAGDPNNRAQNRQSLLGKMLRLDVDAGSPYAIPSDNPFVGDATTADEIWAIGMRNPWKFAFDRETGDLWIADVGQNIKEEINFEAANSGGGLNYGWRCYEGFSTFNTNGCSGTYTDPLADFSHNNPYSFCSITGGYVYRGSEFPNMQGKYFFTDYCAGSIYAMSNFNGVWDDDEVNAQLNFGNVAFGEGANGDLYIVTISGNIYKLEDANVDFNPSIAVDAFGNIAASEGSTFFWYLNGELLDGLNTQFIQASQSGTYSAVVENSEGFAVATNSIEWLVLGGIPGCTYPQTENYNPEAMVDDGSCIWINNNACPSDLNGDGAVNSGDLLEFLNDFGSICD